MLKRNPFHFLRKNQECKLQQLTTDEKVSSVVIRRFEFGLFLYPLSLSPFLFGPWMYSNGQRPSQALGGLKLDQCVPPRRPPWKPPMGRPQCCEARAPGCSSAPRASAGARRCDSAARALAPALRKHRAETETSLAVPASKLAARIAPARVTRFLTGQLARPRQPPRTHPCAPARRAAQEPPPRHPKYVRARRCDVAPQDHPSRRR
jgi:hypothetical protein